MEVTTLIRYPTMLSYPVKEAIRMFKLVTGIVHALYLLMITLYMILAQFSVSSPDETPRNYDLFFFLS